MCISKLLDKQNNMLIFQWESLKEKHENKKEAKKKRKRKKKHSYYYYFKKQILINYPFISSLFPYCKCILFFSIPQKILFYENYIPSSFITLLLSYPFYTIKKSCNIMSYFIIVNHDRFIDNQNTPTQKNYILHLLF